MALVQGELKRPRRRVGPGVGQADRHGDGVLEADGRGAQPPVQDLERAVRQPVAEGEQLCAGLVPIAASLVDRLVEAVWL